VKRARPCKQREKSAGRCPAPARDLRPLTLFQKGLDESVPSGWGQGDCVPLWGAGVKPLQKAQKSAGRCPAPARDLRPLTLFQKGLNESIPSGWGQGDCVPLCGAGVKPLRTTRKKRRTPSCTCKGLASLDPVSERVKRKYPFRMGSRGLCSLVGCRGKAPANNAKKAQDAVLHLQGTCVP
jgi:hypothetical protein